MSDEKLLEAAKAFVAEAYAVAAKRRLSVSDAAKNSACHSLLVLLLKAGRETPQEE